MSFLIAGYQQGQINEAKTDAIEAKIKADQSADRLRDLETTVNHMALACQAMWELLRERVGITEAELQARINEVDLRDGTLDGRMHSQCMYCGAAIPKPHIFR